MGHRFKPADWLRWSDEFRQGQGFKIYEQETVQTKFKRDIEEEKELKLKPYNLGVRELLNDIKTAFYEPVRALKDLPLAERQKQASYWLTAQRRTSGPLRQQQVHKTLYELTGEGAAVESLESPPT